MALRYRTITLNKTYAEMQTLISTSQLDTQTNYKITDRGDRGLIFRAATTNQLEFDGIRYMLCPTTYVATTDTYGNVWIGVWNATKQATAVENNLTIWNGLVWKAGATLAGTAPDAVGSGWVVVPKATFTNHEYKEMIFGVSYDFEEDWINKQWDQKNNRWGSGKIVAGSMIDIINSYGSAIATTANLADLCDWNYDCDYMIENNGYVFTNNSITSSVAANTCIVVCNNSINGYMEFNTCLMGIVCGNSSLNNAAVNIYNNTNFTMITGIWDADVSDAPVIKTGTAS